MEIPMKCMLEHLCYCLIWASIAPLKHLHPALHPEDFPLEVKFISEAEYWSLIYYRIYKHAKKQRSPRHAPASLLSSIIQPSAPKVTITNFSLGNFNNMETSALGTDGAPVHVCQVYAKVNYA